MVVNFEGILTNLAHSMLVALLECRITVYVVSIANDS